MSLTRASLHRIVARCVERWDRFYVLGKLPCDPVYRAVLGELRDSTLPVLDVGCGIGLVLQYLRECGCDLPVSGIDFDQRKIASAKAMSAEMPNVSFTNGDVRSDLPEHHGHVLILDILQYLQPDERTALLHAAAQRVATTGKLIIRSGLGDDSLRQRITVLGDWFAKVTKWMKSAPVSYPTAQLFEQVLGEHGMSIRITPLSGLLPFNNYLIVAQAR